MQELCGNIRVHCRVRPVLEMDKGTVECVTCADDVRVNICKYVKKISHLL